MPVDVIGQQFKWTFEYPEMTSARATRRRRWRPTSCTCRSAARSSSPTSPSTSCTRSGSRSGGSSATSFPASDPAAQDGRRHSTSVNPDREGTFSVVCTELCGTGHATMRATVVVESQEEFDAWLAEQAERPREPTAGGAASAQDGDA